ncbi:MAG: lipocalin-like domain-containing protein [Bacteroidaceae bacterium]|nr:lipocalin-like domain-containing protein [Bacteroidaceae bacterium]
MRHKLLFPLFSLIASLLFAVSCTLETSGNGKLDGAWHLLRINEEPLESTQLYWNIQGKMLEFKDKQGAKGRFLLRFERKNGKLTLSDPHVWGRENGDAILQDTAKLAPFGVDNLDESFEIEKLDNSRMTLKSSTKKLDFRKF